MNIVIVGAGDIGSYLAATLSKEDHNIVLIDKNAKRLEEASWHMDVATKEGLGTDWQLLDTLLDLLPDLFIALTDDDETNLTACAIAKHLGYPRTIARLRDNRYFNRTRLDFARIFDVDYFVGPELLVAHDIFKYMISPGSLRVESFVHGAVQLRTLVVPSKWRKETIPLADLDLPAGVMVGLIRRKQGEHPHGQTGKAEHEEVIFPHGKDCILPSDEVTLIGEVDAITEIHQFFGVTQQMVESAVIIGGSLTGVNLAKILEQRHIGVRLIEKDYTKCCTLSEQLPRCTVINHDGTDLDFLLAEKVGQTDVFVCSTGSDEVNVLAALLGKEAGCKNVVIQLSNTSYIPIVSRLGISHTASPRVSAANRILSLALSGTVNSIVSLYENQAEILEIHVSMNSKVVGIPIAELGPLLPKDFLIAVIQNRGRTMIAHGNRIISPGDTVIVVSNPKHIHELEKIF